MLVSTVVAVALGLTPIQQANTAQIVTGDYAGQIGHYSHYVDRRGTTHLRGRDRRGVAYELAMDKDGYVQASIGDRVVTFRAQEAG
jgi:hypothetical protein